MRLHTIRLLVDSFEECVRFYADVMGLELRLRVPGDVYAEFEGRRPGEAEEAPRLGIYRRELMADVTGAVYDRSAPRADRSAITFRVENVDTALTELRSRGAEVITEPHDQAAWGLRVSHVRDPDGNLIELWHVLDDEPAA